MNTEFMTWEMLSTYAGALAMVLLMTQLTKGVGFLKKLPTQIWSYILAVIVLILSTIFTRGLDWEALALCFFNAVMISIAANGGYSGFQKIFSNTDKI